MTGEKGELSCKGEKGRGKVSGWNEVSMGCRRHFSDVNLLEAALPGAGNGRGGTVVSKSLSDDDQRRTTLCSRCAKLIDQQYSCFGFEMDRTGCVKPGTWPARGSKARRVATLAVDRSSSLSAAWLGPGNFWTRRARHHRYSPNV